MDLEHRLQTLVDGARFDVSGYSPGRGTLYGHRCPSRFVCEASLPSGRPVSLFKVLLTNSCTNDCAYCANQVGRDVRRTSFRPEELARMFMELYTRRRVQGLFLTSGIAGNASQTMESMVDTVDILRRRYRFGGYIHLKILPGASLDCVEEGCKMASRVSVNMEAPTAQHLARLSSRKDLHRDILERMRWVRELMTTDEGLVPSGQTTQFVVGAAGETDRDILQTTGALYSEMELRRVYFSAFRPVQGSPLEELAPTPSKREHRLYQADWLLRVYGFSLQEVELALGREDNLPLNKDPKSTIARKQPWLFPVDVNRASYDELLRVPGIGPLSARRIVEARVDHSVFSMEQLKKMGVAAKRAAPFVWFQGMLPSEKQASFLPQLDDELAQQRASTAGLLG